MSERHHGGVTFKAIRSMEDMASFVKSKTYSDLLIFVRNLCDAVRGKKMKVEETVPPSETVVDRLESAMRRLETMIESFPPLKQPQRFGNKSFRKWFAAMSESVPKIVEELVLSSRDSSTKEEGARGRAVNEISDYLIASFGNPTRLDFGTGHEAHFLIFLQCLEKVGATQSSDREALVMRVFASYLRLARRLQQTYMLEPAGSHGVWSLDDYHLLPFLFGAAQLDGNDSQITPRMSSSEDAQDSFKDTYLYMAAVHHARSSKRGASFRQMCPMLFELSRVRCGWKGLNQRLCKMFAGEVLGKFPVAQHILFGSLMPTTWFSKGAPVAVAKGPACLRGRVPRQQPVLEEYFGDVIASELSRGGRAAALRAAPTGVMTSMRRPSATMTPHTLLDGGRGIRIAGWTICSRKSALSGEMELSRMEKEGGVDFAFPEMVFGGSFLRFEHAASGVKIELEPVGGLLGCRLESVEDTSSKASVSTKIAACPDEKVRRKLVKVPAAAKWENRVDADGRPIQVASKVNYDWTYTSFYEGHVTGSDFEATDLKIDYDLLRKREPILWNDDVLLFESELDDNGTSILHTKIRVMPSCFFCLLRCWVRVDHVLVRVFDTRIFYRYGQDCVLFERTERERSFRPSERPKDFKDPGKFASSLPLNYERVRKVPLRVLPRGK